MKTTSILLHLLIAFILVSCDEVVENGNTADDETAEMIECKSLLVITEDRSGSTTDHRKLEASDYTDIMTAFIDKYSGQVAVRVIGNPVPEAREFFILTVDGQDPYVDVPKDALMSEQGKLNKKNEAIKAANAQVIERNKGNMQNFVSGKITEYLINYAPHKNRDITNIVDAFDHLSDKVNEPTFRNYDKIQVLIISDGIHDATKTKTPLSFNPASNIELFLIGWKDKEVFRDVINKESFDSVEGFMAYYKDQNCNN